MTTPLGLNLTTDGTRFVGGRARPDNATSWDSDAYEAAVARTVDRIRTNPVGQRVLLALMRPVVVIPWRDMNWLNASMSPANRRHGSVRGERPRHCSDDPHTHWVDETGRIQQGRAAGSGIGTPAVVELTPQMWPRAGRITADEMLVHELVHAAQVTRGVLSCRPAGYGYDTFTEFCAITVANMYRSAFFGTAAFQRRNHQSFGRARLYDPDIMYFYGPDPLDDAEWRMLDRFELLMPHLTRPLANLSLDRCPLNPFRRREAGRRLYDIDSLGSYGPPRGSTR